MTASIASIWLMPLKVAEEETEGDKEEDFLGVTTWTLASSLSFIPWFGFMAWVLLSLSEPGPEADSSSRPSRGTYFATLALIYSTPLTFRGFEFDEYSLLMLLLLTLHVQVERLVVTEPSWLLSLRPTLPWQLAAPDRPSLLQPKKERNESREAEDDDFDYTSSRDEEEELQLKQFDRLLMERSRARESLNKLRQAVESAGFVLDEGWRVEVRRVKGGRLRTVYIPPASFDIARTYSSIPSVVKAYLELRSDSR